MIKHKIATVGNPNSGKSTLFNALTGSKQKVGNFSGITVDKKSGWIRKADWQSEVVDLPGVYNIDPQLDNSSLDERIACEFLQSEPLDLVINVVDASAVERSLYLSIQLKELGLPVVLVLNKMDTAKAKLLKIKVQQFSERFKLPLVCLSATSKKQVEDFKDNLPQIIEQAKQSEPLELEYSAPIEAFSTKWQARLGFNKGQVLRLIEQDPWLIKQLEPQLVAELEQDFVQFNNTDVDLELANSRYNFIYQLTQDCVGKKGHLNRDYTAMIDSLLLNRWIGIPAFLGVMYLMFMFAINGGAVFIDFFDITAGTIFVDGVGEVLSNVGAPEWLTVVLANGVGVGIQTVATFIPVIACLYLFLALLESSGYLARAAFVVDRAMQVIGLPGKAFVPMLMGFGCTVPAIMATRVLEKHRERVLTSAMSPFMSCGARLPVYALFVAAFFPEQGQNMVFGLYLIGILAAIVTGLLLKYTLLPGTAQDSVLELPDYQLPTAFGVLLLTWQKVRGFVVGAGKTIVLVVAILSVLNSIGTGGELDAEGQEHSILSRASQFVTPVFGPMGIEQDNWPATVGIVTGLFAKEAVIGTLNSLYANASEADEEWTYLGRFQEAGQTIVDNFNDLNYGDPLGIAIEEADSLEAAAEMNEVDFSTMSQLGKHFTPESAVSFMLFILLYMPCAAAMGALVKELGMKWARLIGVWSTLLAYSSATIYYQVATWQQAPVSASVLLLAMVFMLAVWVLFLKRKRAEHFDITSA
ncbi:Fe(2+) transporter permease subunit FeoB [Agarivorans sp. Toyoura001]|uniref:Fe(2+) transporter permease subunit FeoB n=1 Tax=unclassified Agarivorans TaxID=2636026 RepID=UPI0010E3CBBA|nr:Fe(2+) transporter permease subunit FeoB [Agarivorans sp. Toyoura001]GDY27568.1 ferrous iron transport protein B [Agarivorans sp. Toyoura001]